MLLCTDGKGRVKELAEEIENLDTLTNPGGLEVLSKQGGYKGLRLEEKSQKRYIEWPHGNRHAATAQIRNVSNACSQEAVARQIP